jgi:hypothetical protein
VVAAVLVVSARLYLVQKGGQVAVAVVCSFWLKLPPQLLGPQRPLSLVQAEPQAQASQLTVQVVNQAAMVAILLFQSLQQGVGILALLH